MHPHHVKGFHMRHPFIALSLLLLPAAPALAEVNVGISIGIDVPVYPRLVRVPGHPVYYDPRASSNYFFYDGLYWVFRDENWYSSGWYNGPWSSVGRAFVPSYVLRVPVRYYRKPPAYFRGWRAEAPPRWGDHWGRDWEQSRSGWDRQDRRSVPQPAPLPAYQRQYSGERYPGATGQQQSIRSRHYRYQPRESVTREYYGQQGEVRGAAKPQSQQRQEARQPRGERPGRGVENRDDHRDRGKKDRKGDD